MTEAICIKALFESRNLQSPCRCHHCAEARDHEDALAYYRQHAPDERAHCEEFPDETKIT